MAISRDHSFGPSSRLLLVHVRSSKEGLAFKPFLKEGRADKDKKGNKSNSGRLGNVVLSRSLEDLTFQRKKLDVLLFCWDTGRQLGSPLLFKLEYENFYLEYTRK